VAVLQEYAATGRELPPHPPAEMLQRMMSAGVAQAVPDEYIPLLLEEMRFSEDDTRSVRWRRELRALRSRIFASSSSARALPASAPPCG